MPTPRKVAAQKTRATMLTAVRDRLARAIDTASLDQLPPLVLRLQRVLEQIDDIGAETPVVEPVDEVAERRRKRRGNA